MLRWIFLFLACISLLSGHEIAVEKEEFILKDPPFTFCHASTLIETPQGLVVSYFAGTKEGAPDTSIYLSVEGKDGWQPPRMLIQSKGMPCWNPVLFTLPSNEVLLFYRQGKRPQNWSTFLTRSKDQGETWSAPEILPAGVLGPIKNKPLLLENGTLLCGSSTESFLAWGCWIDETSDGGKTWEKRGPITASDQPFGIIQPTLFHAAHHTLMLLARSHQIGYICRSISHDQGKSWSSAEPIELPNPNSGIDAIRLYDGRIFLVYNHSQTARTPINLAVSEDGGETWEMVLTLESGPGSYSYPAIIQTSDGRVHITYTWNRTNIKHIVIKT
ncbi:MAG: exo-alpha-sialidase [Chlamydiia bacterium]|nr:exo-alpha-sialidase [Chlamydiia bacterium]